MMQKSTPIRILILTTAYLPQVGGSELAIKNITERLPEISFDLITSRPSKNLPEYEKIGNINVYRVGNLIGLFSFLLPKNFLPVAVFFKANRLIRKYGRYNAIHAYQASQAAGGGWLLKWIYPSIPFVVTVQEGKVLNQQSLLTRLFRYFIFRKADSVTVISNYLAQYVKSQNPKVPVSIIPNGVDLEKFKPSENHIDSKTIITASRLVEKNGVGDLIEAMEMVSAKIPDARLKIIGDGPLRENFKLKIENNRAKPSSGLYGHLNLENKIEFLGEISNELLPKYLSEADIFIRPSLSEGLGTAFLEAMASGLPIIGTPVGGIPDFLKDGETGLFCKVGDSTDIADKIIKLFEDGELRKRLTENGRKLVEEKYSWDIIANEFDKIYGRL